MKLSELLEIRDIGRMKAMWIFYAIVFLYLCSVVYYYCNFLEGTTVGKYYYEHNMSVLFAPLYEEVLFRGVILLGLLKVFSKKNYVILWGGILFGIWHLKNLPYQNLGMEIHQVVYTLFLGSFLTWLALRFKTIWLGVIIHFLNNIFFSPLSFFILGLFF